MTVDQGYMPEELDQFNRNIEEASTHLCNKSLLERHAAAWLRQETSLRTKWDEHDNRMRLQDRIEHIRAMRVRLNETKDLLTKEFQDLTEAKKKLDRGLTGRLAQILNVSGECQTLCHARQGINNVHDEVEERLKQEEELANHIKRELEKKSQAALKVLEDIQHMMHLIDNDLEDKKKACDIEQGKMGLTTESYGISLKPDIMRIPKAMVTMRVWLENSLGNLRAAAQLLDKSIQLRNEIAALFTKIEHDFSEKTEATEFAYRFRYNDTLLAARRLEHLRKNLAEELKSVENDIDATERAWNDIIPSMKLCHTRIEQNNQRPNLELVLDVPQEGLLMEAANLQRSRDALFNKMKDLKAKWNDLTEQLHRVELDLERKLKCLEMDKRAMELRRGTLLPKGEKDVIDWQVERLSKTFSADPDLRYQKFTSRVLV